MALLKTFNHPNGTSGEYNRLIEININYATKNAHVVLANYVDKETRDAGKLPLTSFTWDWANDDFPFIESEPQNEREIAYGKIVESKKEMVEVGRNENGEPIFELQETNSWVNAVSC